MHSDVVSRSNGRRIGLGDVCHPHTPAMATSVALTVVESPKQVVLLRPEW